MCGSLAPKAGLALRGVGSCTPPSPGSHPPGGSPREEEGFLVCGGSAGSGELMSGFDLSWGGGEEAEAPMGAAASTEPPPPPSPSCQTAAVGKVSWLEAAPLSSLGDFVGSGCVS